MKIKICGLFRSEDIDFANKTLPDYVGFVFAKSKRQIDRGTAAEFRRRLDGSIKVVGVFVNAEIDYIAGLVSDGLIDLVQLHGDEDEEYVRRLRELIPEGVEIIKAFSVSENSDVEKAERFPCNYILLDNGRGGTGKAFCWDILKYNMPQRVFLAGGVNTGNIKDAAALAPYCIDVSSGAETDGIKDFDKIAELVSAVRNIGKDRF